MWISGHISEIRLRLSAYFPVRNQDSNSTNAKLPNNNLSEHGRIYRYNCGEI